MIDTTEQPVPADAEVAQSAAGSTVDESAPAALDPVQSRLLRKSRKCGILEVKRCEQWRLVIENGSRTKPAGILNDFRRLTPLCSARSQLSWWCRSEPNRCRLRNGTCGDEFHDALDVDDQRCQEILDRHAPTPAAQCSPHWTV